MFESSHVCVINKTDLLPYVEFDVDLFKEYALRINHHLKFIEVSATKGEGMETWLAWLKDQLETQ
jgi:hydrogenase nickel incorporation protein HypB